MENNQTKETLTNTPACNRRNFLTNAGKGVLAASLLTDFSVMSASAQTPPPPVKKLLPSDTEPVKLPPLDAASEIKPGDFPTPVNPTKRIGFAIVGLGHLTLAQILPAFGTAKYCKPVALVSGDAAKAAKVADQYGIAAKNIYNYQNFDNIKDNPEIDVVYIVLPNSMHEEFVIRAAKAGKQVLCEKPMADSSAAAQRMIDACKKANRLLMIAYRIQYEPNNNQMKEWTRNKQYGKVRLMEMNNSQNIGDPTQWRLKKKLSGGGSLPDIGLYCLNTARFLTGEEPEWVMASTHSMEGDTRFAEVEEAVMFQLRFPSGTVVNASCSYGVHQNRSYKCLADNGGWFGMDPAFAYNGLKAEASQAKDKTEWKSNPTMEAKNQFALEMDHFSMCVMNNEKPFTPGEEGLQDHKLMEAIYQSAKEGKAVKLERITTIDTFRGTPPAPRPKGS